MTSTRLLRPFDELIGSKSLSLRSVILEGRSECTDLTNTGQSPMDLGIIAAVAMLVVWAFATFTTEASGWIHALLSAGVFLLIWRIVVRGTPDPGPPKKKP